MDLRQLASFVAVAEELSFQAAARRLRMSQSPLSRQIKALEEELGARLVERGRNKRVSLTDAGEIFLEDARRTLASVEAGRQHVREAAGGARGRLNLANVAIFAPSCPPGLLQGFRAEYPQVEVRLHEMEPAEQLSALDEGRIHACITPGHDEPLAARFEACALIVCPMMAALSAGHPLAKESGVPLNIKKLKDDTLLVPAPSGAPTHTAGLRAMCAAVGFVPAATQYVDGVENSLSMAAAGYGVSIVPEVLLRVVRHTCATRPLRAPVPAFQLKLIWRRESPSQLLRNFLAVVREHLPRKQRTGKAASKRS